MVSLLDVNPREVIGGNNPPSPFDQTEARILELYDEAKNWCDGEPIADQAQADALGKLDSMIMKARKEADELRIVEKRPHDEAAKEVQERFKPLLARCDLARDVCKKALTPYLVKLDAEKREVEERARREADERLAAAQEAMQSTHRYDLEQREQAETLIKEAEVARKAADRAEKDKAHVQGGSRARGLRTVYRPEITSTTDFARYLWAEHPADMREYLDRMAVTLVARGIRQIPGVTVHADKVL